MHVPGEQSDAAQVQSTAALHDAGRVWQLNVAGQPPRQPGWPVPGQLAVAVDLAGQLPPSGGGEQSGVPQLCWLTHNWLDVHGAASPHAEGASVPASELAPPELHPTATSSAASAPFHDRVRIEADANTAVAAKCDRACRNSDAVGESQASCRRASTARAAEQR